MFKEQKWFPFFIATCGILFLFQNCNNLSSSMATSSSTSPTSTSTGVGPRIIGQKDLAPTFMSKTDFQCGEKIVITAQSYSSDGRLWGCDPSQCQGEITSLKSSPEFENGSWKAMGSGRYIFEGVNRNSTGFDQIYVWKIADVEGKKSIDTKIVMRACPVAANPGNGNNPPAPTGPETYLNVFAKNEQGKTITDITYWKSVFMSCGDYLQSHVGCYATIGCDNRAISFQVPNANGSFDLPVNKCASLGKYVWCDRGGASGWGKGVLLSDLQNGAKIPCLNSMYDTMEWMRGRATQGPNNQPYLGFSYIDGFKLAINWDTNTKMLVKMGNPEYCNLTHEQKIQLAKDGKIDLQFDYCAMVTFDKNGYADFPRYGAADASIGGGKIWAECVGADHIARMGQILSVDEFNRGTVLHCD